MFCKFSKFYKNQKLLDTIFVILSIINLPWRHLRPHMKFGPDRFRRFVYKQTDKTSKVYRQKNYLVYTIFHWWRHPGRHQLIQGLQRIIHSKTVGKPCHYTSIGPLIHLTSKEESVSPETLVHGKLQPLLFITME